MANLQIQLLSDFQIISQGQPLQGLKPGRMQALLAFLLLHRHAPQPRQRIAFLFWPDTSEAQARANLRNLLHRLRVSWPGSQSYLHITPNTMHWRCTPDCTVDVAEFEARLAQAESTTTPAESIALLQAALELYHGDLLPDLYDDWLPSERARLRELYIQALEQLASLLEDRQDYHKAIDYAHKLQDAEPLREATHRQLMRLHMLGRDRAAALRAYHACATILQNELGVEPSAETRLVYDQILNSPEQVSARQLTPSVSPLVGRQAQWKQLTSIGRQVSAGRTPPQAVLIRGEAGIGKTRLAEEFLDWARRQGSSVIWATCYAADASLPYATAIQWLRNISLIGLEKVWQVEIGRLIPELLDATEQAQPDLTESWQRLRLFEALSRAILTQKQPIFLALDDLQWCDKETLAWLHHLLHLSQRNRLLFLGTIRTEELVDQQFLARLAPALQRSRQWSEIRLPRLDKQESGQLAAHLAGRNYKPIEVSTLFQATEGNPLFIVETVRAGLGAPSVGIESPTYPYLPETSLIASVLSSRLEQLSPTARRVVDLAAVIGREFRFDVLEQAAQWDEELLMQGLDELWQRRIVREQGVDGYDFSHDRLRQYVYAALNPARRWQLHRRVARALEALHASELEVVGGLIARHYAAGGKPTEAARYHYLAAKAARKIYAHQEALHHLQQALAMLPGSPESLPLQNMLYEQLGDILVMTGQHEDGRQAYQNICSSPLDDPPFTRARAARKSGNSWRTQGDHVEAWQAYDLAETFISPQPMTPDPDWWQAWLDIQLDRLLILYYQGRLDEMVAFSETLRPPLEAYGSALHQAEWMVALIRLELRQTRYRNPGRAVFYAMQELELVRTTGDLNRIASAEFNLGFSNLWCDKLEDGRRWVTSALAAAEQSGNLPIIDRCLAYLGILCRLEGKHAEVEALLARGLAMAMEVGYPVYIGVARANLAWLSYLAGNTEQAESDAQAALQAWSDRAYPFYWLALWPLLGIALQRGDLSMAIEHAQALLHPIQQALPPDVEAALTAALAAWEQPEPALTRSHLQEALELAHQIGHI
jgi:DNA-binding SARP family transcriptional activator/tetratricopeptide (TPR) repeat protein